MCALIFLIFFHFILFFSTLLFTVVNSDCLTFVRHSSCKSSATHAYQCVQYISAVLLCVQTLVWLLMHVIAHWSCMDTVRVCYDS